MDANDRAKVAELYDILEEMLWIAVKGLHDTPLRASNRDRFVKFAESTEGE